LAWPWRSLLTLPQRHIPEYQLLLQCSNHRWQQAHAKRPAYTYCKHAISGLIKCRPIRDRSLARTRYHGWQQPPRLVTSTPSAGPGCSLPPLSCSTRHRSARSVPPPADSLPSPASPPFMHTGWGCRTSLVCGPRPCRGSRTGQGRHSISEARHQ
jgi:hypothetical protein